MGNGARQGRREARSHCQTARRRADRCDCFAELDAGRAASACRASRVASAARISTIACVAPISVTRRAIRCSRRSVLRSRISRLPIRCWSSARTFVKKCRCSRIAFARLRCSGGKISFINPQRYEYLFPVAGYLASNGLGSLDHLIAVTAAAINARGKSIPASIAGVRGPGAADRRASRHRATAERRRATFDSARRARSARSGVRRSSLGRKRVGGSDGCDAGLSA